jgi:hypothetical protein
MAEMLQMALKLIFSVFQTQHGFEKVIQNAILKLNNLLAIFQDV